MRSYRPQQQQQQPSTTRTTKIPDRHKKTQNRGYHRLDLLLLLLFLPPFLLYNLWNQRSLLRNDGGGSSNTWRGWFQASGITANKTNDNDNPEQNRWITYHHCSRSNNISNNNSSGSNNNNSININTKDWCLDDDQVPQYVGEENRTEPNKTQEGRLVVRHYNHAGYERCLANKTVVFVGDSRVRYQFMHLVSFLASKQQMQCQDFIATNNNDPLLSSVSPDPECYLIEHKSHMKMSTLDWNDWYNQSTALLAQRNEQQSLCDCFRLFPFQPATTYENRFIQRTTPYGIVNLVFLQNFNNQVRLNKDYPPFSSFDSHSVPERCQPGTCSQAHRVDAFSGTLNETLWTILPLLNATHAFVSLGWEFKFPFVHEKGLSCNLQAFEERHSHIAVDLINHVPVNTKAHPRPYDATRLNCPGVGVMNRWDMARNAPKSWYWDTNHVLGILNEAFNHKLVERLCPMDHHEL